MKGEKLKIKRLKVRAFRGFVDEREFEFAPVTILFGSNGSGKSSTLNAIEWCFFGKDCIGKDTGIRERIDWEIKNRYTNENPLVEIELENGNKIVRKWKGGKKGDSEATGDLEILKGYSFRDFLVGVYQHQEVIRAILVEEPRVRNEGFDRLLGLSKHRNLLSILQDMIKKGLRFEEFRNKFNDFKNKINSDVEAWTDLIEKNKEELKKKGVEDREVSNDGENKYKTQILNNLENLINELSMEPLEEFKSLSFESPTKNFVNIVREQISRCRSEMPDLKRHEDLAKRRARLNSLSAEYENAKRLLETEEKKLKEFIGKEGKKEDLENRKKEISERIKQVELQKEQKNLQASAIEKALKYLEGEGVDKNICPVCGKETVNLLDHLKSEWERKYKLELEELNKELSSLEIESKRIERLIREIELLEQNKEGISKKLEENIQKIREELGVDIKEDEDPKVIIGNEIKKIEGEMEKIKKVIEDKQSRLNSIDDEVSILEKIGDILELELRRERARDIERTEEWGKIGEKFNELNDLKDKLEKIIDGIRKASKEEVKHIIDNAGDKINEYFKRITNHPGIEKIIFDVKEDLKAGYSYEIKDDKDKPVISILSQGHLNALALSVFLALCENMPFEFIMLDDPSQSLSSEEKKRFVEVLDEVSSRKNIIISTMDQELYDYLVTRMTKQKKIYMFNGWSTSSGPIIEEG